MRNPPTDYSSLREDMYKILKWKKEMHIPDLIAVLEEWGWHRKIKNLPGRARATIVMYSEFEKVRRGVYRAGTLENRHYRGHSDGNSGHARRKEKEVIPLHMLSLEEIAQQENIPRAFIGKNIEILGTPAHGSDGKQGYYAHRVRALKLLYEKYQRGEFQQY